MQLGLQADQKKERGQAMVESALITIILVSMILFIMDIGRLLLVQQFATERARVGARYAVVNNWTSDQVKNYVCYNSTSAPSGGTSTSGFLGLVPSEVTVSTLGTSGQPDYRIQVKIQNIPMITWIPYMQGRYTAPPIIVTLPAASLGATN